MKRGQITLFIIVGLVVLITIVILWLLVSKARPGTPPALVDEDTSMAQTCLAQTTRAALDALRNDGFIEEAEGGTVPRTPTSMPYLYVVRDNRDVIVPYVSSFVPTATQVASMRQRNALGFPNYLGLCNTTGANGFGVGGMWHNCHYTVYDLSQKKWLDGLQTEIPSIQHDLTRNITAAMQACLGQDGKAEVIIQEGAVLVRWNNPSITYTERTDLHTAWKAIAEIVRRETTELDYRPGVSPFMCTGCADTIRVRELQRNQKSTARPWNIWEIRVAGEVAAIIHLADRPILFERPGHDPPVYQLEENSIQWSHPYPPENSIPGLPEFLKPDCTFGADTCVYNFIVPDGDELDTPRVLSVGIPGSPISSTVNMCCFKAVSGGDCTSGTFPCYPTFALTQAPVADGGRSNRVTLAVTTGCFTHNTYRLMLLDTYGIDKIQFLIQVGTRTGAGFCESTGGASVPVTYSVPVNPPLPGTSPGTPPSLP